MKLWVIVLCLLVASSVHATKTTVWQPTGGHTQTPLWPGSPPDAQPMPGPEESWTDAKELIGGKPVTGIKNVAQPTMTVYAPQGDNTGAAVVVFPGGGFQMLAMDLEGTEVCDWLTSRGITCVLLKYRVPSAPYQWQCDCRPHNRELSVPALEDAQRALRLLRFHAAQWHVDSRKIGVIGFSAGGYLVAEVSTHFAQRTYAPIDAADRESSRPDFALAIYPGHLADDSDKLNLNVAVSQATPPTFLLQAEDDYVDGVNQALVYYNALRQAKVPAEMHLYPRGGHAFGLRPTSNPITHWPVLAETWMSSLGVMPAASRQAGTSP